MYDSNVSMWWFKGVQHYHSQQSQISSQADTGYSMAVWSFRSDKLMFYSSPCMSGFIPRSHISSLLLTLLF